MNPISAIGNVLAQVLVFFKNLTGSYGMAIILLTLAIKVILHPLTRKQLKSMKAMQVLAPHMTALREKYKDDPKTLNAEIMNLYRAHSVSPFSGCLPMVVQLPVLWGLFSVLRRQGIFNGASFLGVPLELVPTVSAIAHNPMLAVAPILVGASTFWQQQMTVTDPQQARMFIFMPILVAYFATQFPIGLSIYWIVSTLAYIAEYYLVVGRGGRAVAATAGAVKPSRAVAQPAVLPQRPKGTKKR